MFALRTAKFALTALSLVAAAAQAASSEVRTFAPDNDLWMEDNLDFASNVTEQVFLNVIAKAKSYYDPIAQQNRERLVINARWSDATVNANCSRNGGTVTINMYGGLARREEITQDGFALVLCHEIGHAYGGTPYIQAARKMSAEGQSDYWGAQTCLKAVLPLLPETDIQTTPYMENKCAEKHGNDQVGYKICLRQMAAGQSTATLLSVLMKEKLPNYETPDPTVVRRTLTSYPDTTQCRLDTYHNGVMGMARPACWFKN